ncbi:two-component system sensor histidine kinase AtoS, partial [Mycobacterium tuberculosis]|nr:two-component system sensor histidine kinase AtoS [Mycobacterium tuberculosis]
MDFALTKTYEEMLADMGGTNASREEKIRLLNSKLEPLTNKIAAAHPGIGAGYYAKELDAILTYGPVTESSHVGKSISADHPGREVLRTRQPDVVIGEQVRGNIMNAMIPLIREGDIIGYVWANELMSSIDVQ